MVISVKINEQDQVVNADPSEKLMTVLRRNKLYSVKCGCTKGYCGNCTVLLNGHPVPSCTIPVGLVRDNSIVTLEHFMTWPIYSDIAKGFEQAGVHMCGYCNAGKIFTAYEVLTSYYRPTIEQLYYHIDKFNLCCTDRDTLANGIMYAVAAKHAREGRNKNARK